MGEVREFLQSMGLAQYAEVFEQQGYDTLEILWLMDEEAVRSCISKPGHLLLFQSRLEAWRSQPEEWSEEKEVVSETPLQLASGKRLLEAGIDVADLSKAESDYFDLTQLPTHWLVFIVLGLIIGTGLHCWVYRQLTGDELHSSHFASETMQTLDALEQVMDSLHLSLAESEAMMAASAKDSPIMAALERWRDHVQAHDFASPVPL
mmetsp:Transcript_11259/g.25204  ORF Transcript_11259/g.25204 Transcript_11259/m.25204 type:complete len:206 (-) Transcript_11259:76-693(-)